MVREQTQTVITTDVVEMQDANNDVLLDANGSILSMKVDPQVVQIERQTTS